MCPSSDDLRPFGAWLTEYLAHLLLKFGCVLVVHQAAVLDGPAPDALTLQQDGLPPAEIDISRGQVAQALVVSAMVMVLDEGLNLQPEARPAGSSFPTGCGSSWSGASARCFPAAAGEQALRGHARCHAALAIGRRRPR